METPHIDQNISIDQLLNEDLSEVGDVLVLKQYIDQLRVVVANTSTKFNETNSILSDILLGTPQLYAHKIALVKSCAKFINSEMGDYMNCWIRPLVNADLDKNFSSSNYIESQKLKDKGAASFTIQFIQSLSCNVNVKSMSHLQLMIFTSFCSLHSDNYVSPIAYTYTNTLYSKSLGRKSVVDIAEKLIPGGISYSNMMKITNDMCERSIKIVSKSLKEYKRDIRFVYDNTGPYKQKQGEAGLAHVSSVWITITFI
jgi:hypothetical protein